MWPTLFKIPYLELPIRGYGLMLMIAFLGGTWWASRRAERVKANPDLVVNMGFVALLSSVIGARIFYVLHYWDRFEGRGLWAMIDVTAGGMEFYGGFIGGFIVTTLYIRYKKISFRLYADIVAPSLMLGMGFARIGCFLNGCCWGAPCQANLPWAVQFPYASPAQTRQWEERMTTLPAELIVIYRNGEAAPLARELIAMNREQQQGPFLAYKQAREALAKAEASRADAKTIDDLRRKAEKMLVNMERHQAGIQSLIGQETKFGLTPDRLLELAGHADCRSRPIHPSQLYSSLDGFLLAILLNALFYHRRRQGVVMGWMLILYPVCRVIEEAIRIDNPHDTAGLTISQFVSLTIFTIGVIWLVVIYRLPLRSPKANTPWTPVMAEPTAPKRKNKK